MPTRISFIIDDSILHQLQPLLDELTSDLWQPILSTKVKNIRGEQEKAETAEVAEQPAEPAAAAGRKVLYHPIIPTRALAVGTRGEAIRVYLLEHGPTSAQDIERVTGLGRKVVESTLWKLRHDGLVESRAVGEE